MINLQNKSFRKKTYDFQSLTLNTTLQCIFKGMHLSHISKYQMKLSHIQTPPWMSAAFCHPLREFWHMRCTTFIEANESVDSTINLQEKGRGCLVQSDWQWPIFHHDTHITKWIIKVFNLMVILEIKRGNIEGKGGNNSVIDCL